MKHKIVLNLFLITAFSYGQGNQIHKIVVDKNSKIPLENVLIFNEIDNSTTNSDGEFMFVSQKNEININLLGYTAIKTSFDALKNTKDTIFMESKAIVLEEVLVSNTRAFMKKVYEKSEDNFLQNLTVNFFLRNVLKKNNITYALQDISGKRNINTLDKKKKGIEILNMRKTKIIEIKDQNIFQFPSFKTIFNVVAPTFENCSFTEVPFSDSDFKKILFETTGRDRLGQIWKGYFIINRSDYAVVEYNLIWISDPDKVPFSKKDGAKNQYRTIKYNKLVKCTKDLVSNKYYVNISQLDTTIEDVIDEKSLFLDCSLNYFMTKSDNQAKIKPNFPEDKDIFKAKFLYSKDFWDNQNQLPLTQELEHFLKSVADKKDKTKQYEIIGNF